METGLRPRRDRRWALYQLGRIYMTMTNDKKWRKETEEMVWLNVGRLYKYYRPCLIWFPQLPRQWALLSQVQSTHLGGDRAGIWTRSSPPPKCIPVTRTANSPGWGKARWECEKKEGLIRKAEARGILGQSTPGKKLGARMGTHCHRLPFMWRRQRTQLWVTQLSSCKTPKFLRQHTMLVLITSYQNHYYSFNFAIHSRLLILYFLINYWKVNICKSDLHGFTLTTVEVLSLMYLCFFFFYNKT